MARPTMYQVDAFSDRLFAGNPAAVLVLDAPMPKALMQAIAAENNLAETAYAVRSNDDGHWDIRWFTPTTEAAFCGHATLATAHVLHHELGLPLPLTFRTRRVGPLTVAGDGPARYRLDLPALMPEPVASLPEPLSELLAGRTVTAFRNFENYFVVLPRPEDVLDFRPDLARIARLHPFGLAITAAGGRTHDGAPVDFLSRYFAPGAGIDEDPVTGSAHASLVPLWAGRLGKTELRAFQASRRGGELACRLAGDRVFLSGAATTYLTGTIFLPDDCA